MKTASMSSANNPGSGNPGSAISTNSAARTRSQPTITARRENRSPIPASQAPPAMAGRNVQAKLNALAAADPVRSNTSTASATRATWSPMMDCISARYSTENARTRRTSTKRPFVSSVSGVQLSALAITITLIAGTCRGDSPRVTLSVTHCGSGGEDDWP